MNYKIIFFGSDFESAKLLEKLIQNKNEIVLVITKTEKNTGRLEKKNPVKKIAQINNLNILEKDSLEESDFEIIKNLNPDLGVLLAYGAIHPSLLPKYRGPSPIQSALLCGEEKMGVSIILLSKYMDAGPIIIQKEYESQEEDNYLSLSEKLFKLGIDLLIEVLDKYLTKKIIPKKQNKEDATYCKLIKKEDGLINWNSSSKEISNKIKAFYLWPNTYTKFNDKILKIKKAKSTNKNTSHEIGEVFIEENILYIQCKEGLIIPEIVQIEVKTEIDIKSFINGYKNFIGTILK